MSTRIVPPTGEIVGPTKRRPVTPARKRRCHDYHDGICLECRQPVPMFGPAVRYDHFIPVWMGGPDDDGPNWRPIHRDPCDIAKCARDAANIAHVKALLGETGQGPKRQIPSRGFERPNQKPAWPKRKFWRPTP